MTEIICVLDRSGSMQTILDDAIGGFNRLLQDQQAMTEGRAVMTIVLFDDRYEVVAENKPVAEVQPFTRETYRPRGLTALLDAVGQTIDRVGERYAAMPEHQRPGKVLFVILTDGQENCSRRYGHDQVATMVQHQTDTYQWEFMYLSADINAFNDAKGLGIATSVQFAATGLGTQSTYDVISSAAQQYRSHGAGGMSVRGTMATVSDTGDVQTVTSGSTGS